MAKNYIVPAMKFITVKIKSVYILEWAYEHEQGHIHLDIICAYITVNKSRALGKDSKEEIFERKIAKVVYIS
jgi:hypothetical protein